MAENLDLYIDEITSNLELLNNSLITLQDNTYNPEVINDIFRAFHSIKGSFACLNFNHISEFIHNVEDLLQSVRENKITLNSELVQLLFISHDYIYLYLDRLSSELVEENKFNQNILNKIYHVLNSYGIGIPKKNKNISGLAKDFLILEQDLKDIPPQVNIYKLYILIKEACPFKATFAYMVFDKIKEISTIIKSYPLPMDKSCLGENSFEFEDNLIRVLVFTNKNDEFILKYLDSNLIDIENIRIEKFDYKANINFDSLEFDSSKIEYLHKDIPMDMDKILKSSNKPFLNTPDHTYSKIKDMTKNIEIYLLALESDTENISNAQNICNLLSQIKLMSLDISENLIIDICKITEQLLDTIIDKKQTINYIIINLVISAVEHIKKICENNKIKDDATFLNEVDINLKLISKCINIQSIDTDIKEAFSKDKRIGQILVETGKIKESEVEEIISKQKESYPTLKFGEIAIKEEKVDLKDIIQILRMQETNNLIQKSKEFMKIPIQQIDIFLDLVQELFIIEALSKNKFMSFELDRTKMLAPVSEIENIIKNLQNMLISFYMVPLKDIFQKISRVIRDTSIKTSKDIDINISGDETNVNSRCVEKLYDILMHISRNAVYHGIEDKHNRIYLGKPEKGTITIKAYGDGLSTCIEFSDDGKGMSILELYKKAVEKNLIDPNKKYLDWEILNFIYLPGFSTEDNVNNISGRGVGMNIVHSNIKQIGGNIEIKNKENEGCKFILKIPTSTSIINVTLVSISNIYFAIPSDKIEEIIELSDNYPLKEFKYNNQDIEILDLMKILDLGLTNNKINNVLIVNLNNNLKALPVNSFVKFEKVAVKITDIKSRHISFLSGISILNDNSFSIFVDLDELN